MTRLTEAAIRDAITSGMTALNVPGCAYARIEGCRVTESGVFGTADAATGRPVTPDTRFSLQSISKSFAAWAVMVLVERGEVDLDAPIHDYLTSWRLPPSDRFDLDLVTPRRLLSHHAGVTVAGFLGLDPADPGYTLIDALDCRLPPPNAEQKRHWDYWNLADSEPVSVTQAPGSGWAYSNAGFALLQLMIEDVTGRPFRDFVTENVLAPLGLADSTFGVEAGAPYAEPHGREGQRNIHYICPCDAAGGLYATISDLAAFACASMPGPAGEPAGRGVIRPQSLAVLHSSHGKGDQSGGRPFEAGLGHVLLKTGDRLNVHHSGGTIGWRSIYTIFPDSGDGFCMVMNGEASNDLWVPLVQAWRESI